jgi:hypothetical protein
MSVRILKIVPTLLCGGTENQAMALGRALDPKEYSLEMACLRRWGPFVHERISHPRLLQPHGASPAGEVRT